jgi:hypothetical protein
MALLDGLQEPPKAPLPACKVRETAAKLEPKDAEILLAAVEGDKWKVFALEAELRRRNLPISSGTLSKHRSKACSCSKI